MDIHEVKKVAVIGAGAMGNGIAQLGIMAGYAVVMQDIEQRFIDRGVASITDSMGKLARKGKMTGDQLQKALSNLTPTLDLKSAVADADIVIEAVPEILELKKKVFADLDKFAPQRAVLASNTSNMSITEIADATSRPDRVVGMHFFNPAVLMKLVEVIYGAGSSDESVKAVYDLGKKMERVPVIVHKDSPGFIYNRINAPGGILISKILDAGTPTPEDFDMAFKPSAPMAPFELMDFVGIDVCYHGQAYYAKVLSPDYTPSTVMKSMIDEGKLGMKTGMGFYDWSKGRPQVSSSNPTKEYDPLHFVALQVNEATKLLEEGVVKDPREIDLAMSSVGGGIGPFILAQQIGYEVLVRKCMEIADKFQVEVFYPTKTMQAGNIKV